MSTWVPDEPTEEMVQAGQDQMWGLGHDDARDICEAMLAAAPSPWQLIATFPDELKKDGTFVLLQNNRVVDGYMAAFWDSEAEKPDWPWETVDGQYYIDWPTHWLPLPYASA